MTGRFPQKIRYRQRYFTIQGHVQIRRRSYLLLQLLSRRATGQFGFDGEEQRDERWLALDARRGALDSLKTIQILPHSLSRNRLRMLQQLSGHNPFAARIVDYERRDECTMIVSEWIPGMALSDWLQRQQNTARPISLPEAMRLYRGLVQSLCGFHRTTGLVHGDVHPSNMVIGSRARWVTIIDYGSAWRSLEAIRCAQSHGFRALWAAPELNVGQQGDLRSDQFSATLLLFVLLTGEMPFERLGGRIGHIEVREQKSFWMPPSKLCGAGSLNLTLTRRIDRLVGRCLAIAPQDRFQTDSEWLSAVKDQWDDCAAGGPRGSLFDRFLKRVR